MDEKTKKSLRRRAWLSWGYLLIALYLAATFIFSPISLLPLEPTFYSSFQKWLIIAGIFFYVKNFITGAFIFPGLYRSHFSGLKSGIYSENIFGILPFFEESDVEDSRLSSDTSCVRSFAGFICVIFGSIGIMRESLWPTLTFDIILLAVTGLLYFTANTWNLFSYRNLEIDFGGVDKDLQSRHERFLIWHKPKYFWPDKEDEKTYQLLASKAYTNFLRQMIASELNEQKIRRGKLYEANRLGEKAVS